MKKFSKNAKLLLSCLLINGITSTFIYTYLLAFILDISNNGIVNVAIFYLVLHVTMIILSWVMAPLFKKFNKALSLKLGIIFKFLFVIIVVFLGKSILKYVYIIAIFNAFSEVTFWGGANPLQPVVTDNNNLSLYISLTKIFSTIIGLIVPILMGFCIDQIGMHAISIAMVVIVVIQLILSMFINEKTEIDNTKLRYREFWSKIKTEYPKAKKIYWNQFIYGFCTNVSMVILYYTVITFGSNISIGIFSAISSILSIIILTIYNVKKRYCCNYIVSFITSSLIAFSIIFVILSLNKTSLILFYTFWNISIVIPETRTSTARLGIIKQENLKMFNVENVTISETYLDFGRIAGEIMLLLMGIIGNRIFDIICMCLIIVIVAIYYFHIHYISKNSSES